MLADIGAIFSAFGSQDSWEIREALKSNAAWWLGLIACLVIGFVISTLYRLVPLLDRHLERTIMVASYLAIAGIIFWGVIDRFVFANQQPWSTTIPPLLFMIMAWFGASFNIRLRTHLSFSEFRSRMPRTGQFICLCLDNILWLGFALILLVTTTRLVALSASNFQIVLGTDNTMQWWFLMSAPMAAAGMCGRIFQNFFDDLANLRSGDPLIEQAVIGGDV